MSRRLILPFGALASWAIVLALGALFWRLASEPVLPAVHIAVINAVVIVRGACFAAGWCS